MSPRVSHLMWTSLDGSKQVDFPVHTLWTCSNDTPYACFGDDFTTWQTSKVLLLFFIITGNIGCRPFTGLGPSGLVLRHRWCRTGVFVFMLGGKDLIMHSLGVFSEKAAWTGVCGYLLAWSDTWVILVWARKYSHRLHIRAQDLFVVYLLVDYRASTCRTKVGRGVLAPLPP